MAQLIDNMRGALLMMGAMTGYTVNDAFMRAADLPVMLSIFWRGLMVVPFLMILCHWRGHLRFRYSGRDWLLLTIRSVGECLGAIFFLTALYNMPFANVSAILQSLPLTVSLGAALLFGEPLGWRRLLAICVGFGGVLLIVQPGGADFNRYALFAVGCVVVATIRDLAARRISAEVPSTFAGLVAAFAVMGMAGVGTSVTDTVPLTGTTFLYLVCAALFILAAYICSVSAMRVGEIGFVAPFRYTSLLVAMVLGAAVFGEIPSVTTLIGAAIVVCMGLFTLYRERQLRRRQLAMT